MTPLQRICGGEARERACGGRSRWAGTTHRRGRTERLRGACGDLTWSWSIPWADRLERRGACDAWDVVTTDQYAATNATTSLMIRSPFSCQPPPCRARAAMASNAAWL